MTSKNIPGDIKSKSIKVSIDGHGSDELFIGYGHIKKLMIKSKTLSEFKELISINESTKNGIYSTKQKKIKRKWVRYKFVEFLKTSLNDVSEPNFFILFNNSFAKLLFTLSESVFLIVILRRFDLNHLPTSITSIFSLFNDASSKSVDNTPPPVGPSVNSR